MQISSIAIHNFRSIEDCTITISDYSLMIGLNNAGKSNVFDALRIFYQKLKYNEQSDYPKFQTSDKESWIEIEYSLSDNEYESLKDEWKQPDNKLKVRNYFKRIAGDSKLKLGMYAYKKDGEIDNKSFYSATDINNGKLGNIIYIPAASKIDEHTKLSGPSVLRELLVDIFSNLVKSSQSFKKLTSEFEEFSETIKAEKTDDKKSLHEFEQNITSGINEWGVEFELDIKPVSGAEIIKTLVSYKLFNKSLKEKMDAEQFGQGFQRHLIFTLIHTAAKFQFTPSSNETGNFEPEMTFLLFEEPEAFLHPAQQRILCLSLKSISKQEGHQTFVSSHSTHFVSYNSDDIPSIIRLNKNDNRTLVAQIDKPTLKDIFYENQKINELLKTCTKIAEDDLKEEMEVVKYFLWLDSERCGMFFAGQVLLVEGATEKVLFNYLFNNGDIEIPTGGIFVLDCLGKYNIHRFMNLLSNFKILHSVLIDEDIGKKGNNKKIHKKVLELIKDNENEYTFKINTFPQDIEDFLDVTKSKSPRRKPQHLMLLLQEGKIKEEKMKSLKDKVRKLIKYD